MASVTFVLKRDTHSACRSVLNELKIEGRQGFKIFVRMSLYDFKNALKMDAPLVKLQDTTWRNAVSPAEQPAVTLRFLATGVSFGNLMNVGQSCLFSWCP
jgi:hypothetical protein